jgi:hypothetical protein
VQTAENAAGLDPGPVDPTWPPPSGNPSGSDPPGSKTMSASLVYGSILVVLVLLVVAIWGLGGFKRRTDLFRTTPPGTLFTTGPYEFRFIEATAQHKRNYDNTFYWEIVVIGEGRTTGKESISPNYMGNSGMFASKDDASQEISMPDSVRMGESRGFDRHRFTPSLPLSPYSVAFKYKDAYRPGPTIRFVVSTSSMGSTTSPARKRDGTTPPMPASFTFRYECCQSSPIDPAVLDWHSDKLFARCDSFVACVARQMCDLAAPASSCSRRSEQLVTVRVA